jgi:hypothetical protein
VNVPYRAARLVAWGNAWLAGLVPLAAAAAEVARGDDAHAVAGPPLAPDEEEPLVRGLAAVRAAGVTRLRLVLPVPGDVRGLPGPDGFRAAALRAGEAVVCDRPVRLGLVPAATRHGSRTDGYVTTVRWSRTEVGAATGLEVASLAEVEADLQGAIRATTAALSRLDVARPDDRAARAVGAEVDLPPGFPARAHRLLATAERLSAVLDVALSSSGGAVTAAEAAGRAEVLRSLGHEVRRARQAGYNAGGVDAERGAPLRR